MKLHLPFVLLAAVLSAASYTEAVTHSLNADTSWENNSTTIRNQDCTIEGINGTSPDFEISDNTGQVFYSQSNLCGSTDWIFQNLNDINIENNSIAVTNPNLSSYNPAIYQGIFSSINLSGYGVNTLQIANCGDVSISNNYINFANSTGYGAPILAFCQYQGSSDEYTIISIDGNNNNVLFDSNTITGSRNGDVSICGGCIMVAIPEPNLDYNHPVIRISGCEVLTFSNNAISASSTSGNASAFGGATYGGGWQIFDFSDNKNLQIKDNAVTAEASAQAIAIGGGTFGNELKLSNVQSVTVSGNSAESYSENGIAQAIGGGIMQEFIILTDIDTLVVSDNTATADGATTSYVSGGGLAATSTSIIGNGQVEISNNASIAVQRNESTTVTAIGGGIEGFCLTIADNQNVSFRGNYIKAGDETNLSALTLTTNIEVDGYLEVSAPEDGSVVFYDPITVTDDNLEPTVNFNKATAGVEGSGEGTIVFSGKYTEEDLANIIGRAPTADEIEASRTSSIASDAQLHGGTLRVQEQAIFSAEKLSAQEGSNARVQVSDASVKADTIAFGNSTSLEMDGNASVEGKTITFSTGSSLTLKGLGSTIKATTITFEQGSTITVNVDVNTDLIDNHAFTIDAENTSMDGTITLNLNFTKNLRAGTYKILLTDDETWTPDKITTSGIAENAGKLVWIDGVLCYSLTENLVVVFDPLANAVQAANWGVYKSSQAFTSLLWAPHTNAVTLAAPADAKGRTLAWGSVYSSFTRNGGSGSFSGAEYNIIGGAIGVERQSVRGRSLGIAFGYDWGKASPFTTSRVDQESWHASLYGRAAGWKLGRNGSIALDWSATVGSTTSEHKALGGEWSQDNLQLDIRATYSYARTERTSLYGFVGAQYYAQTDDSTALVKADSMQNLRLMMGAGISYRPTEKTTLFGEVTLFNDTMRHNPNVTLDGYHYGTGANPGRLGGSVTAGAQYQLRPNWTLRGSYSYEGADNSNEHRVNVGAVYSF